MMTKRTCWEREDDGVRSMMGKGGWLEREDDEEGSIMGNTLYRMV
jgi:hypothetical protein